MERGGFAACAWSCARLYGRRPELVIPFAVQELLGLGASALVLARLAAGNAVEGLSAGLFLTLLLLAFLLQGWALRWGAAALAGEALGPGRALREVLRRLGRLIGVSLWVTLPGGILVGIVIATTEGWIAVLGLSLAGALIAWLSLLAMAGVLLGELRAGAAVREAFLLLGASAGRALGLFTVLLLYGQLASLSSIEVLGALMLGERPAPVPGQAALGTVLTVSLGPWIYLLVAAFYRDHGPSQGSA